MRLSIFIFTALFFLLQPSFGQETNDFVAQATQNYQKGEFQQASDLFKKALDQDPNNPSTLYNWGLSEYKLNHKGAALGAWRKALAINPTFSRAQKAVRFAEKEIPRPAFAEDSFWESYRHLFRNTSMHQLLLITAILISLTGFLLIRYLAARKQAFAEETPLPPFPIVLSAMGVLTTILLTLTISKMADQSDVRATVVALPATLRTLPDSQATSLADLPEGAEVILRRHENNWVQVTYPGGITGWIEQEKLLPATGKQLW